jgi:hypothetical protein
MRFVFEDGRREEMLFLGPDRPGFAGVRCGGFLWDGHGMCSGDEPFSQFLRALPLHPVPLAGLDRKRLRRPHQ